MKENEKYEKVTILEVYRQGKALNIVIGDDADKYQVYGVVKTYADRLGKDLQGNLEKQ